MLHFRHVAHDTVIAYGNDDIEKISVVDGLVLQIAQAASRVVDRPRRRSEQVEHLPLGSDARLDLVEQSDRHEPAAGNGTTRKEYRERCGQEPLWGGRRSLLLIRNVRIPVLCERFATSERPLSTQSGHSEHD